MLFRRYLKINKYSKSIKFCLILFLLYGCLRALFPKHQFPKYYDDGLRTDWLFKISRYYTKETLCRWTEPVENAENEIKFTPTKYDMDMNKKLAVKHKYNVMASARISLRRALPDIRSPECRNLIYPNRLPTTSVIIVVHNEIWSTLLRTIWSVIDRSPRELLEEIILVDDASTWATLKQPLNDYVLQFPVPVRIIRTDKREGLIRARLIGANHAKGSVLTFLDAHIECVTGWLQPLLSRIANDRSVVAVPLIDPINSNSMQYIDKGIRINGLRWNLIFDWSPIPERELIRTKYDNTAPIRTPTHIGCAFSIDREFFYEIGSYDEGMQIWGSENVELAFRVWMCGGALEIIPCSRVGHLFRVSTYSFEGDKSIILMQNNKRVIEVWMDEFKYYIYETRPDFRHISTENLTERINIKKRLKCKSFRWYLENIFPESVWLNDFILIGQIKNSAENYCIDRGQSNFGVKPLLYYLCHNKGGAQFFALTISGQIYTNIRYCVGISKETRAVILVECSKNDQSQLWHYDKKELRLYHRETALCVGNDRTHIMLSSCNEANLWDFKSNLGS